MNFGRGFLVKTETIKLGKTNLGPVYQAPATVEDFKYRTIDAAAKQDGLSRVAQALLLPCIEADGYAKGKTPLIISAEKGLKAAVRLLIDQGVDINAADDSGRTALHYAGHGGHEAVVQQLLKYDVKIHAKDNDGKTALQLAIERL
jgi:hypothetical protein